MSASGYRAVMAGSLGLLCFFACPVAAHAHGLGVDTPPALARTAKDAGGETVPAPGDSRIRVVAYSAEFSRAELNAPHCS